MKNSDLGASLDKANSIWQAFVELCRLKPSEILLEQFIVSDQGGPRQLLKTSRAQALRIVSGLAAYLQSMHVGSGSKVAILSATRPEWLYADLAILACGGVSVSVYQSLPSSEAGYILFDSGCEIVFAENQEQISKLLELVSFGCEIPATEERAEQKVHFKFKRIICFEHSDQFDQNLSSVPIVSFQEILKSSSPVLELADPNISREDLASLVYTSGTTGPPKGVMQSHGNHLANVRQALQGELVSAGLSIMLFLPLAHSFARLMGYVGALCPCTLKFPAVVDRNTSKINNDSLRSDISAAGAHIVPMVPRILEKMRDGLLHVSRQPNLRGKLLQLTLWAAQRKRQARVIGKSADLITGFIYTLTTSLRRKIKHSLFGKNFLYSVSGGAKLNPEVCKFFDMLGIEILEGYGLTETCVATNANKPGRKKIGTVGPVLAPDIKLKIAEDGEILFSGPNIAHGYLGREAASAAAWDAQGWYHTGDLGSLDSEGFLKIEGRKKEILVTSYGKNVAPDGIEQKLKSSPYISHAMLVGDGRAYCCALLTLEMSGVESWAKANKLQPGVELLHSTKLRELIAGEVEKVNKTLASFETIKKFAILSEDFSIDNGLLTPTLKVKRKEVMKRYAAEVESLYAEE